MERNQMATTKSELTLNNRNALNITGIKKIRTTEPTQVVADLDNCTIVITGTNLNVQNASIQTGILEVSGIIGGIKFTGTTGKRWSAKNLFR